MQVLSSLELTDEAEQQSRDSCREAQRLIACGDLVAARQCLAELELTVLSPALAARVANDLGVIDVLLGDLESARTEFLQARALRPDWHLPGVNLWRLGESLPSGALCVNTGDPRRTKVALVSLLFNWPSTGGGTVHTAETARFLQRDGYDVRHLSIRFDPWGLGQIKEPVDWPLRELAFSEDGWHLAAIQERVRAELDSFRPDAVIVTDSWSMKPRLAEACRGYPTYLRLAAQECLCPLNNVRLLQVLPEPVSCPRQQLAAPEACRKCVQERQHLSGSLHQLERDLAGFGTPEYEASLRRTFADAAGVLVVNPLIAELCKPYSRAVHVIPSGFDPARFPWTDFHDDVTSAATPTTLLFAGLPQEAMKGFPILLEACRQLWSRRQDFRLKVTAEPGDVHEPFCEFLGWQSQDDLPRRMRAADVVVCPTIAEEALGRTAVEAMGAWRPVVASRIGGLPFTVLDEATGLLCRPGDVADLTRQLERLIDDVDLRERLGRNGRRRFESEFTWPVILERGYRPLLGPAIAIPNSGKEAG